MTLAAFGIMASFLVIACGVLRLARFNIQTGKISKQFFIGLPIPAAACTLAAFVLFSPYLPEPFTVWIPRAVLVLAFLVSILMVSNVRYASFKDAEVIRVIVSVTAGRHCSFLCWSPPNRNCSLGFIFFIGYIISGLIYSYFILPLRGKPCYESLLKDLVKAHVTPSSSFAGNGHPAESQLGSAIIYYRLSILRGDANVRQNFYFPDTTLRDGEQSPGAIREPERKNSPGPAAEALGVDIIEAGSPAASQGDFEAVRDIAAAVQGCQVAGLCRALHTDIDRAWEAVRHNPQGRIHTFLATSDIHMQYKPGERSGIRSWRWPRRR